MFDYPRKTALQMVEKFLQPGSIVPVNQQTITMLVHALREMTEQSAQRKPLTDDEIESINVRLAGKRDLARLFARAIEKAHGITNE